MRVTLPIVLSVFLASPHGALAGEKGVLAGQVLQSRDHRLVAKTVWIGAIPAAVASDGSFEASGIPTGPSELAIETSEGLYLVGTPVTIAPGTTRRVQLAFAGRQDISAPPPPENQKKKRKAVASGVTLYQRLSSSSARRSWRVSPSINSRSRITSPRRRLQLRGKRDRVCPAPTSVHSSTLRRAPVRLTWAAPQPRTRSCRSPRKTSE